MKILSTVILGLILIGGAPAQEEEKKPTDKTAHSEKCPAECKTCSEAIKKALDYLASQQKEDGHIPAEKFSLTYVKTDKYLTEVMTTVLTGLSFLAGGSTLTEGPHKERLVKIRDYLKIRIVEIVEANPRKAGGGGGPIYSAAWSLIFFTHLYEKEKDDDSKKTAQVLVQYLSDCVGPEITDSLWAQKKKKKRNDNGSVWFVSGVTALVNSTTIALGRARAAGFEVEAKVFDLLKSYYPTLTEKNGSIKYDKHDHFPNEPRTGRSITSLLALKALGAAEEEPYQKLYEYARKNMSKTMTHHTPTLHTTLCAFTFHTLGAEDWRKYVDLYFEKFIARQEDDGSVKKLWDFDSKLMMTPNDLLFGKNYATAQFSLILQIPLKNVTLYRDVK